MKYELIIHSCAESEISDAALWYEKQRRGLGSEFLQCIDAALESIQRAPNLYTNIYKNVRRALIKRFPYSIFYILENGKIVIIAVFHEKRNPNIWKARTT